MSRPRVLDTCSSDSIFSFEMWPKKTFFGLDKSEAHCFTLPKELTLPLTRHFSLGEGRLQDNIVFIHRDKEFAAQIRFVRMNRSKPNKLSKSALPKRDVIQFQWKNSEDTQVMFRRRVPNAFELIMNGEKNPRFSVIFHHVGGSKFLLEFNRK